jgi:hypothetical protein
MSLLCQYSQSTVLANYSSPCSKNVLRFEAQRINLNPDARFYHNLEAQGISLNSDALSENPKLGDQLRYVVVRPDQSVRDHLGAGKGFIHLLWNILEIDILVLREGKISRFVSHSNVFEP